MIKIVEDNFKTSKTAKFFLVTDSDQNAIFEELAINIPSSGSWLLQNI